MKRKIAWSRNEYVEFVNAQNNRTNVYTTVYDFEHFSEKAKIDSTVILDRMFLDFDGHDNDLELAWRDVQMVMQRVIQNDWKHTLFFSGRGFHLFLFGERTDNIRNIQIFFREFKSILDANFSGRNTLDERVGQTTRLRRVPNTVNMSSADANGNPYYCIPLTKKDLSFDLESILSLAQEPRHLPFQMGGNNLVVFPEAPPIQAVGGEVSVPETIGKLPMLPCLHNAVMTENPSHISRAYLVSWYRDLITGYTDLITLDDKVATLNLVVDELERVFAESDTVWLDWDKDTTKKHARFTVFNNYNTPHCDKLINEGFCIGKCWRFPE
tara:strand:+ start:4706 stop:5683 length:978 start_codon:yes stop_codon:yes gene_type:complete